MMDRGEMSPSELLAYYAGGMIRQPRQYCRELRYLVLKLAEENAKDWLAANVYIPLGDYIRR